MDFFDVFGEMLVILAAIAAGFAANRLGYLGGETDQRISKLLLNITMPAMIVAAVITGEELPEIGTILSILEVSVVFYLLAFAFVLLVPRFLPGTPGQKGVWRYALAFPNVGFIGYPVAVALFGEGALFYAAILALPFNLLSFSLGPLLLAGAARFRWKQLFAPCIVASVLGLVLALTRLRPPALVGEILDFTGGITVPLSLLVVGSLLAGMPAGQVLRSPRLWVLTDGGYPGNPVGDEPARLVRIDPESFTVEKEFVFAEDASPSDLQVSEDGRSLYFLDGDIWKMDIGASEVPSEPYIVTDASYLYALTVNPATGDIYAADAMDFSQAGVVSRYSPDGKLTDEFNVGVCPGAFCWY